ncbi:hypothetical protein [Effusibacillus pohliae]|uniref:hypothetical protein n=1 Tax=Effusibacillus pohliae TaxID=232270 RepID=UPI00039E2109|nr:hypothetical protein [Effusibacillus pohliae]
MFPFILLVFFVNKLLVVIPAFFATCGRIDELSISGCLRYALVDNFFYWDAGWYGQIAERGYDPKSAAFFPFYPILLAAAKHFMSIPAAGVLISNGCFLVLLFFAYKLIAIDYDETETRKIMWLIAVYPTSFFFSAVYTEALYFMLMLMTLYYIRTSSWTRAAMSGSLLSITRNTGVFLTLAYTLEYFNLKSWNDVWLFFRGGFRRFLNKRSASVLLVLVMLLPFFAYMAYLQLKFHDPFAFSRSQPLFGRGFYNPLLTFTEGIAYNFNYLLTHPFNWYWIYFFAEGLFVLLTAVVLLFTFRKLRLSYWILMLILFLIPLSAPARGQVVDYFVSYTRYSLVIFPLYLGLYELFKANRWLYYALCLLFGLLLTVFVYSWSLHRWVA